MTEDNKNLIQLYIEEIINIASTKRINGILVSSDKILTQIIINCKEILKLL